MAAGGGTGRRTAKEPLRRLAFVFERQRRLLHEAVEEARQPRPARSGGAEAPVPPPPGLFYDLRP